ncbi:hypothetical protein [Pseudarthrobacter sp. 1C304]|uniref:hypothetical protein n=1 Tax=Pseudarthrobacter sp. 1C304 TaxID=3457438 RepID=UPI003FD0CF58
MGCSPPLRRVPPLPLRAVVRPGRRHRNFPLLRGAAAALALALTVSCSAGGSAGMSAPPATTPPATATTAASSAEPGPVTAGINQLRDNYGSHIIAIQLTNTTAVPVTVLGAALTSPLFAETIEWPATPGGIELPPGQPKILPAQLRDPECGLQAAGPGDGVTVKLHLEASTAATAAATVSAADPYGVLGRNNAEMCLAAAAAAVAGIRLDPELVVSADGQSAILGLAITPRNTPGAVNPDSTGTLTINWIDGTTLIGEDPAAPWPRSVSVHTGGVPQHFGLGIRPARCDPHAIADDKVGTLMPLRVSVGGRDGVLKIDAGTLLRGRIYEFITAACGRQ